MTSFKDNTIDVLNPCYDTHSEVGRLKSSVCNGEDTNNYRLPVVLSIKYEFVWTLIMDEHQKLYHIERQCLLCQFDENYWTLRAKRAVRYVRCMCEMEKTGRESLDCGNINVTCVQRLGVLVHMCCILGYTGVEFKILVFF